MAPNFKFKFKLQSKSCLHVKVYIILFQSRINKHVLRHSFYDKHYFELSTGDVIMNMAVLFSLRFAENMLNMS